MIATLLNRSLLPVSNRGKTISKIKVEQEEAEVEAMGKKTLTIKVRQSQAKKLLLER